MAASAYTPPAPFFGIGLPQVGKPMVSRSLFGDLALVAFLLAQCFDGVFTYVGVTIYGAGIEANPLLGTLMASFGHGTALVGAKSVAGLFGIALHVGKVHGAVAFLACFYLAAAILPWVLILFV
jgi:hypothetical protein